ncbi:DsbA family oxidoreductase [Marinobacter sp. F4206]|uniref:DsbA family oxidoreductase n=1 Tax=Marinobacter sp. F4206 TaxID=2861777 RepID=UPI001C5F47B0|nr:DsbA family oxidoreductase [Marinobacter sp. F4206]MBW4934044.1 DsbA family oxidoreductase [Marinobacter sp. F4206]
MTTVHIDIVSDIACPWCAIGYARLEKAMAELKDEMAFSIEWHAFELNPDPEGDGEPILQALSRKYGRSPEEMQASQAHMMEIASGLGLNFSKLQERHTRNTFDAHRLVKWAGEQGRQTEMKMACFDAYFGRAENIASPDVLVKCAESIGLDGEEARGILASDRYAKTVREDEGRYRQAGVSAVPAYIVNQKYMISGAQEPATLVGAFREIASEP